MNFERHTYTKKVMNSSFIITNRDISYLVMNRRDQMWYVLFRLFLALLCSAVMMTSGVAFAHEQKLPPGNFPPGNFQQGGFIIIQTATSTVPNNTAVDLPVTCPAGRIATGGGGAIGAGGAGGIFLSTTGPFPAANVNNPTGWHVIVENASGITQPITAWVLCIRS